VGYARDVESVPILLDLIHGDRLAVMDAAIWALGEIRSADALPKLHRLLHAEIRVADCLEAIGKIADESSLVRLLPILVEGADEHREKATWATARILRANDGRAFADDVASSLAVALERAADRDTSRLVRFHAIVGLSLLGRALEPKRILAALGGQLGAEDLDAMGGFFAARNKPTPGAPRAPAAPKPPPARGAPPPTAAKPKGKGPGKT
jgi:HEAT repeat protein